MKLVRSLALMLAFTGLSAGAVTLAHAQEPKKPKATKPADADDKAGKGSVEVYEGKSGWRYRVKNSDGKTIAMATKGYESKDAVLKELDNVKTILNNSTPKEVKE